MIYVAIDLGTYLCRFVVFRRQGKSFNIIKSKTFIVNFGSVRPGNLMDDYLKDKILQIFSEFKKYYSDKNKIRCVATAAMRFSQNAHQIQEAVFKNFGINVEIISPAEEIYLSALGCINLIETKSLLIDVGSGSTEIAIVERQDDDIIVEHCDSLELGLVNNLERRQIREINLEKLHKFRDLRIPVIFAKCSVLNLAYNYSEKKEKNKFFMKEFLEIASALTTNTNLELGNTKAIGIKKVRLVKLGLPWIKKILKTLRVKEFIISPDGLKEGIMRSLAR